MGKHNITKNKEPEEEVIPFPDEQFFTDVSEVLEKFRKPVNQMRRLVKIAETGKFYGYISFKSIANQFGGVAKKLEQLLLDIKDAKEEHKNG